MNAVLLKAADIISERGFSPDWVEDDRGRVCLVRALSLATNYDFTQWDEAYLVLRRLIPEPINWCRAHSQAEIVAKLREAAA